MKIGELVERLESVYETLSKCENAIDELKAERDALAAQVEALRDTCSYWINHARPSGDCSKSEYNTWLALGYHSRAMTKSAQQHLAEIKAQAVEQFALHVSDNMNDGIDRAKLIILASEHISSIRWEVK